MRPWDNQTISKPTDAPLFPFWVADRGLSFFLGFPVLIAIFVPMIRLPRSGRIGLDLIFAFTLFSGAVATIGQNRVARSMAMAEALIGQLYPSILIATLVGMVLQARSSGLSCRKSDTDLTGEHLIKQEYFGDCT